MTEVLKRYIDASNAFRKAKESHQGAVALYDLLYDLQAKTERTKEEECILTDTYSRTRSDKGIYPCQYP